jgi:hypothetical protein
MPSSGSTALFRRLGRSRALNSERMGRPIAPTPPSAVKTPHPPAFEERPMIRSARRWPSQI